MPIIPNRNDKVIDGIHPVRSPFKRDIRHARHVRNKREEVIHLFRRPDGAHIEDAA